MLMDGHRSSTAAQRRGSSIALCGASIFAGPGAQARQPTLPLSGQHVGENGEMLQRRQAAATWTLTYNSDANADIAGGSDHSVFWVCNASSLVRCRFQPLIANAYGTSDRACHQRYRPVGQPVGNFSRISGLELRTRRRNSSRLLR